MDIEARTRRSLEWERLKAYLAAESCSQWSKELCLSLETHTESLLVDTLLKETAEALAMLSAGFGLSQEGLPELRPALSRLRTGAQMSSGELLDIKKTCVMARRTRSQLAQLSDEEFPKLKVQLPLLDGQEDLVRAIDDVLDDAGNVKDTASPLLHQLRRDVQRLNNQSREELLRIINSNAGSKALQEPIFTQRNGRYVLPVQVSMRSYIDGIVHDSSASGLTVYVEPFSVVELTNKARLKEADMEREIDRLLSELSARARERGEPLEQSYRALVEIDFIAARARLAQKYNGVLPELSSTGDLQLKAARHPLLVLQNLSNPAVVVSNDIMLGGGVRTLVITGPNTGGKTVFLKTAGLLSLMVRAGLLLPVQRGSSAVIFSKVFADVGDEQSIEQSLSTFSSHMTNIVEIINRADEHTLALLDEVGAGTDPREGAILARVVLERLNGAGTYTVSTTHYGELKSLAYTTEGFVNGSFEFDEKTLSPTYHLRIGVPGSSKAIAIAARLGLPKSLVEQADALLSSSQTDIQNMIEELEERLADADRQNEDLKERQQALEDARAKVEETRAEIEQQREKIRSGAATRIEQELEQANDLIRSLIADLQKAPSIAKAQRVQKDLQVIRQELGWLEPAPQAEAARAFAIGQTVKVRSLNQRAVIEALPEEGKTGAEAQASVRAGAIKIKVPLSDLQPIEQGGAHAKPAKGKAAARLKYKPTVPVRAHASRASAAAGGDVDVFVRTSSNTLDLRGQRVDAALANLESFVDAAYLEHISPLMIIHGHGTGAMKSAVRSWLSESPYSVAYRPGETYEGGDGVTIVNFK